jgi:sugar/nucleoside kinase (ribokinase family)
MTTSANAHHKNTSAQQSQRTFDCIVAGSCVLDVLCHPVNLDQPIGRGVLHDTEPFKLTGGGICSNSGITMARLGMKVGVFSCVGDDDWGKFIRNLYADEGVDIDPISIHPTAPTSSTMVLISQDGERSFFHCVGAPKLMTIDDYMAKIDLFTRSRFLLWGYYGLNRAIEPGLADFFKAVQAAGCKTAMDSAGAGGDMTPLDQMLPFLDVYVPSLSEATNQTGEPEPEKIIQRYRDCGATGILGVKLGTEGVLLSDVPGRFVGIPVVQAPGPVIDTTGAGDSFYAGLLTGLAKGLSIEQAGKLGTAAGACCVTTMGGCTGGRDYQATAKLAGL